MHTPYILHRNAAAGTHAHETLIIRIRIRRGFDCGVAVLCMHACGMCILSDRMKSWVMYAVFVADNYAMQESRIFEIL